MASIKYTLQLLLLCCLLAFLNFAVVGGFQQQLSSPSALSMSKQQRRSSLSMGFLDNILKDAFSNDESLSRDGVKGSIVGPEDATDENFGLNAAPQQPEQTEVQKRWIQSQLQQKQQEVQQRRQQQSPALMKTAKGAPLTTQVLTGLLKLCGGRWISAAAI